MIKRLEQLAAQMTRSTMTELASVMGMIGLFFQNTTFGYRSVFERKASDRQLWPAATVGLSS